jgi:hypothetical protein
LSSTDTINYFFSGLAVKYFNPFERHQDQVLIFRHISYFKFLTRKLKTRKFLTFGLTLPGNALIHIQTVLGAGMNSNYSLQSSLWNFTFIGDDYLRYSVTLYGQQVLAGTLHGELVAHSYLYVAFNWAAHAP